MKITVISGKNVKLTARALTHKLDAFFVSDNTPEKVRSRLLNSDFLLRYGNTSIFFDSSKSQINNISAIRNTSNKLSMFRILKENNIPTPEEITEGLGYWRARDNHVYLRERKEGDLYGTKPLNVQNEYRALIFNGIVYALMLKKPLQEAATHRKLDNCNFIYVRVRKRVEEISKKICESLGLTFAGIDLILTTDNKFIVIEANSAPGLGERNQDLFINELTKYIERI